jgi:citrate synthase
MLDLVPSRREEQLLTSRQAADRLGVKLETLYAYVARGLLRAEKEAGRGNGHRARRYSPAELESFQSRRRWNRRVVASAVSSTDGGTLLYRGRDAVALAERCSFEAVAALLWTGAPPPVATSRTEPPLLPEPWPEAEGGGVAAAARAAREAAPDRPLLQAQIALAVLAAHSPEAPAAASTAPEAVVGAGKEIVAGLVAAFARARGAPPRAASSGRMAERVLVALGASPGAAAVRLCERALVLSAEHELNASTFAGRVAASTGAALHAVVAAGLATLGGPKHGGMTDRVEALFRAGPPRVADAMLGFGHPLYPDGDPRTPPLLAAARRFSPAGRRPELDGLLAFVDAMRARGAPPPTVDVGLAATAMALGLAPGLASLLFAFGRTAGWIAHAIEQYAMGELIRPRARYVGPLGEDVE